METTEDIAGKPVGSDGSGLADERIGCLEPIRRHHDPRSLARAYDSPSMTAILLDVAPRRGAALAGSVDVGPVSSTLSGHRDCAFLRQLHRRGCAARWRGRKNATSSRTARSVIRAQPPRSRTSCATSAPTRSSSSRTPASAKPGRNMASSSAYALSSKCPSPTSWSATAAPQHLPDSELGSTNG